ncbi:MAG: type II toxin-antitoxin system RelE family toxin [Chloroflexaceae bacterium]
MENYTVEISDDAEKDLTYYRTYERRIILENALALLRDHPENESGNQKKLRDNPIAPWEFRIGKYQIFYTIEQDDKVVVIVSIGHKEHNTLYIRGKVVQL